MFSLLKTVHFIELIFQLIYLFRFISSIIKNIFHSLSGRNPRYFLSSLQMYQ